MTEIEEMRTEAVKAGRRKVIFIVAFIVFVVLSIMLAAIFVVQKEVTALLLCIAGIVWSIVLLWQFLVTRKLLKALKTRIALVESGEPGEPGTYEPQAGDGPGEP